MMVSWICHVFSGDLAPAEQSTKLLTKFITDVRTMPLAEREERRGASVIVEENISDVGDAAVEVVPSGERAVAG